MPPSRRPGFRVMAAVNRSHWDELAGFSVAWSAPCHGGDSVVVDVAAVIVDAIRESRSGSRRRVHVFVDEPAEEVGADDLGAERGGRARDPHGELLTSTISLMLPPFAQLSTMRGWWRWPLRGRGWPGERGKRRLGELYGPALLAGLQAGAVRAVLPVSTQSEATPASRRSTPSSSCPEQSTRPTRSHRGGPNASDSSAVSPATWTLSILCGGGSSDRVGSPDPTARTSYALPVLCGRYRGADGRRQQAAFSGRRRPPPRHEVKGVVGFVPVYLESNQRIDAFAFFSYIAVSVHAL